MALGGYDGSIRIDTRIDTKNMNTGLNKITQSLKGVGTAVGIAFSVAAVVNFGKASIKAASDFSNAMAGLKSIVEGQGRSFKSTKGFIDEYISDGLLPATEAATAYKNLAMRGYSDSQIEQVMVALKNSAAFGRQASLTLGQAVSSATEGLKNENSILVDNAGVTKNVSMMWKEYAQSIGVGVQSLTKQQKIQAEINGILNESRYQMGDASKLANTYSGQILQLKFNFNNLKIAMGNCVTPIIQGILPTLNAMLKTLTKVANAAAQVFSALFGTKMNETVNNQNAVTDSVQDTVNAENQLAESAKKAEKAMLGIDEINKIESNQEDFSSALPPASSTSNSSIGNAGPDVIGDNVELSPKLQAAVNTLKGIASNIKTAFEPTKQALKDFWIALEPFNRAVGKGLLWFWEKVLVPFGTWVITDAVPAFLNLLSGALKVLTPVIDGAIDGFSWLWDGFLQSIAKFAADNFVDFLKNIAEKLSKIGDWLSEHQWVADFIGTFVAILGGVALAIGAVNLACAIGAPIVTAFATAMATAMAAVNWPLVLIAAVVAIAVVLIKYWDEIKEVAKKCWDAIVIAWEAAGEWFKTVIVEPIKTFFNDLWNSIKTAAKACWDWIILVWTGVCDWFNEKVIQPMKTFFSSLWDGVKTAAQHCWEWICSIWQKVASWFYNNVAIPISNVFNGLWNGVKSAFSNVWDFISSAFKGYVNGWIYMIEHFINFFVSGINLLIRGINKINFKVPDWIPGLGGKSIGFDIQQVPNIQLPRLATGAVIPPRAEFAAILGDQKHGRNIEAPESLIRQIVREESNHNNTPSGDWTIQIVGVDGDIKAEKIITALERHNRRMGRTVIPIG